MARDLIGEMIKLDYLRGELEGMTAIVTGAAGLCGSETAKTLAYAGANVVLTDIAQDRIDLVSQPLADSGLSVSALACNITVGEDIDSLIRHTVQRFGALNIICNVAGATRETVQWDLDFDALIPEHWDDIFDINLRGPMLLMKRAIPEMRLNGGAIVNVSSGAADAGNLHFHAYGSSKSALNTLTQYVATTYGRYGIRCNGVSPGPIKPIDGPPKLDDFFDQSLSANCLLPRLGIARDIAEAIAFLVGPRSSFITGQILSVDGGMNAHDGTYADIRRHLDEVALK